MNKCSSKLLGYIPVVLPHIIERNELLSRFEEGLNELISLGNNLKIRFQNDCEGSIKIVLVKDVNDLPIYKELWEGEPSPFWEFWFIEVSTTFEFSEDEVESYIGDFFDSPFPVKVDLYKAIAAKKIEKISNDLLLAINIAKCGLITTSKGIVLYDSTSTSSHINGTHNLFFEAQKKANEVGWPPTFELELKKVWNWLTSFDFFHQGIGEGSIGRAISALTYLLKDEFIEAIESINLDMIWILIGLEALYGRDNVGLKNQIIEKSRAFFGEPIKYKKVFGKSYDLRSRVIHGDIDLPFRYCAYETHRKYENLSSDLRDARMAALSLLLSTIQKLITEEKRQLNFKYHVI
jgi:hypothetical protein